MGVELEVEDTRVAELFIVAQHLNIHCYNNDDNTR